MAGDPLSFASLAGAGPRWLKEERPGKRRCRDCEQLKDMKEFSKEASSCMQCVTINKLRRLKKEKTRYAQRKRQEMRDGLQGKGAPR